MKVRAGKSYKYNPNGWDVFDPKTNLSKGDIVTVVNLPGCPKANTMGCCHVNFEGKFIGLVSCNSLTTV